MLRPFAAVRPHERRPTIGAFLTLFGTMAGHVVLETARDALFLARLPATRLPWVYIGIAAASLVIYRLQERAAAGRGRRLGLSGWLVGSAAITMALAVVVHLGAVWSLYALYTWTGVFGTLVLVRFWILVQGLFTVTQAKRLFALIGAGSGLGAIAGSALARVLADGFGAPVLLPAAALLFGLSAAVPLLLLRDEAGVDRGAPPRPSTTLGETLAEVRSRPYLRRVGLLLLVSTVTLTLVDYLFKSVVGREVAPEALGSFFASVYLVLNAMSLAAQLLLVGPLLRAFGVSRALGLLPALLVAGGAAVASGGALAAALALKGADGALRYSLHRTAFEVLYVPIAAALRDRVKMLVEVIGQRGGQALASVAILLSVAAGLPQTLLGFVVVGLGALWIYLADDLREHYLELFRSTLREGIGRLRSAPAALDVASLESLIGALSSQDDGEVISALEILAERRKTRVIPLLILYHPSSAVLLKALDLFTESRREDLQPMVKRLLANPDPEVRAAALRAASPLSSDDAILALAKEDPSPTVQVTALVLKVAAGSPGSPSAQTAIAEIEAIAARDDEQAKVALARAMRQQRPPALDEVLLRLADDPRTAVRKEVVRAMRSDPSERFVPALLLMLESRELRAPARAALRALGDAAFARITAAMADGEASLRIRRHLPRTLVGFPPEAAARSLLERLPAEPDGIVRYKVLRALGRIHADHPGLALDERRLQSALERNLQLAFQLLNWRIDLERGARVEPSRSTAVHGLLVTLLRHKQEHAVERIFRLLGLLFPREDLYRMYRGLRSDDGRARASGLELLANLLRPPLREALLGLLDSADDERRLLAAGPFHAVRSAGYAVVLNDILKNGGTALQTLAAYHGGELGLEEVRPELEALGPRASPILRNVLARAGELLSLPASERLAFGR